MLSHLRFHRRGTSNPSSPVPEHQQSFSPLSGNESPQTLEFASPHDGVTNSATASHAPLLPPIARVASSESDSQYENPSTAGLAPEIRPQQAHRLSYNGDTGFIGGAALKNYRRDVEAQQMTARIDIADRANNSHLEDNSQHQNHNNQEATSEFPASLQIAKLTSFSTPTDLQGSHSSNLGRRPAGARLPSESPMLLSNPPVAASLETQRGKKGLPFLKNPMSTLLMRRRNNQNAPDLHLLPLNKKDDAPAYDPRIRGTRVHDFSAPRKSREAHTTTHSATQVLVDVTSAAVKQSLTASSSVEGVSSEPQNNITKSLSEFSRSQSSRSIKNAAQSSSSRSVYFSSDQGHHAGADVNATYSEKDERNPVPRQDASDNTACERPELGPGKSSSVRSSRSRNISLSEASNAAIPKHMKSTSSRFSFDMAGAAKQEKLLEERHRQRELERKTTGDDRNRDSRFDEFGEDAFDYDDMMDDDGLEEKIPGVNADLEDEDFPGLGALGVEIDPDNDQENFAGFVFQRSDPSSTLASPYSAGVKMTPRDGDGNVIGFAMSEDTPGTLTCPIPSHTRGSNPIDSGEDSVPDSGMHGSNTIPLPQLHNEDDLYYDDGMIGLEEDIPENHTASRETNGQPFDESIFDVDDTDQFGRPVPGAFQQAQSLRRATQDTSLKRESGLTSRTSAPSTASSPTTRTSISADDTRREGHQNLPIEPDDASRLPDAQSLNDGDKSVAAYQAALAAAAHRAVATGKLQRTSSPSSATFRIEDDHALAVDEDEELHGYDEVDDDFDFGDDAIIAEANASALANDSDGWYGQEFGFYSAPPGSQAASHAAVSASLEDYEYANGGFFGPGGMDGLNRSTSGRMISREPNLTPITERSEYSNRNSLMSLGYPPFSASTPIVQSPGLAQLAMKADTRDDQMTLSALLRLRSKAWGGSQASLASSREGSPRSERGDIASLSWSANSLGVVGQTNHSHSRKPSTCLAMSHDDAESDGASASGSPTITMANTGFEIRQQTSIPEEDTTQTLVSDGNNESYGLVLGPHATADDPSFNLATDPSLMERSRGNSFDVTGQPDRESLSSFNGLPVRGHRHKSSVDSVSYFQEENSGETRWVLERRRTAESGEVEVLDREVIEGRRI